MSLAYKVEELLALRDSVSESAVSIDKFADEDVIKEHVLRPSASACLMSTRSENIPKPMTVMTPGVAAAAANKKPSPSPSIKRGKAERLLKEHGSPPGMRVTAGGRVVPSDLPPLGASQSGNFRAPAPRGISPSNGTTVPTYNLSDSSRIAYQGVQIIGGLPYVLLGNQLLPLSLANDNSSAPFTVDGVSTTSAANGLLSNQLVDSANSLPTTSPANALLGNQLLTPVTNDNRATPSPVDGLMSTSVANPGLDLAALKQQHATKKAELRNLEQTEVLRGPYENDIWRSGVIAKKRGLILDIDNLRKKILALEPESRSSNGALQSALPSFPPQYQQSVAPSMYPPVGIPNISPYMALFQPFVGFPYPSTFNGDGSVFAASAAGRLASNGNVMATVPVVSSSTRIAAPPSSPPRRSHAIEIKPPREESAKSNIETGTRLDPKSPTYEPPSKVVDTPAPVPVPAPAPAPAPLPAGVISPNTVPTGAEKETRSEKTVVQKPSTSSISTADFFPTNTHEYSSTRIAPNKLGDSKRALRENTPSQSSPDKGISIGSPCGTVLQESPMRRLTSWTEEVVKLSVASASRRTTEKTENVSSDAVPITRSAQRLPSGYQEGYQMGLHHYGLPSNADVLLGYLDGLSVRLRESARIVPPKKNSHGSSIRGISCTPQGSAVSLTLLHNSFAEENMRSPLGAAMLPIGTPFTGPVESEVAQNARRRKQQPLGNASNTQIFSQARLGNTGSTTPKLSMQPSMTYRYSGLDGAMDDLAELMDEAKLEPALTPVEPEPAQGASCFPSISKGKSPVRSSDSPNKEHSPAKAQLERVTSKFRWTQKKEDTQPTKKDGRQDPSTMSPQEKEQRRLNWRNRFTKIKREEAEMIAQYKREQPKPHYQRRQHAEERPF